MQINNYKKKLKIGASTVNSEENLYKMFILILQLRRKWLVITYDFSGNYERKYNLNRYLLGPGTLCTEVIRKKHVDLVLIKDSIL